MTGAQNSPPSNFRRLVLCCIKSDFHNQICVGKRLTRSTQSVDKASCASGNFEEKFRNRSKFVNFWREKKREEKKEKKIAESLADFQKNSTKLDQNFGNLQGISWNLHKFAMFWVNFGMPYKSRTKSRTKNARSPGCPPPSWRWGFGGRRRILPWEGGGKNVIS